MGNVFLPEILEPLTVKDFAISAAREAAKFFCNINAKPLFIQAQESANDWNHTTKVYVVVGPEGGFSAAELADLQKAGFIEVGLAKNILRGETAGIVAATLLLHWIEVLPLIRYK